MLVTCDPDDVVTQQPQGGSAEMSRVQIPEPSIQVTHSVHIHHYIYEIYKNSVSSLPQPILRVFFFVFGEDITIETVNIFLHKNQERTKLLIERKTWDYRIRGKEQLHQQVLMGDTLLCVRVKLWYQKTN